MTEQNTEPIDGVKLAVINNPDNAIKVLKEWAESHFDAELVDYRIELNSIGQVVRLHIYYRLLGQGASQTPYR